MMVSKSTPIRWQSTPNWEPPTPPDLSQHTEVTIDCETDGLHWYRGARPVGMAVRLPASGEEFYLPWGHKGGQNLDEAAVREWATRELRGKRIRNLATKFDVNQIRAWGVDLAAQGCTFHDVAHSAALLDDHRREFSLNALAEAELGLKKLEDIDTQHKAHLHELPAGLVAPYAITDVRLVDELVAAYTPRLAAENLGAVAALEDSVIPVVCEMEWNGCPLDEEKLARWTRRSAEILDDLNWNIARAVGFQVNPDRSTDMTRLFNHLGISSPHRTATGAPSYTAEVMQQFRHISLIDDVVKVGKLQDLRSKYLLPYTKLLVNGHLYGNYHQLKTNEYGTVSGRFSSSGPNLQQVMTTRKQLKNYGSFDGESFIVRELFIPKRGTWFCADQEQVEFRLAGHYANAKRVIDAYARDPKTDFHDVVRDMIRTQKPDFDRKPAKDCNFAIIYGAGAAKRAVMMGMSLSEAQTVVDLYDAEFPEMKQVFQLAMSQATSRGYVRTILGRRARFPNGMRAHKALNAVVQGSAADINKLTLVDFYNARKELGVTLRATVHDEIDCDLEGSAEVALALLNQQRLQLRVPILWAGKTGATWAEAK